MMMELGIYQIEVPISAVFAVQPWNSVEHPQVQRSWQSAAFLHMWALELCFLFFHPLFPQVSLCRLARELDLQHLKSYMDATLDKVFVMTRASNVDLQKRFPAIQIDSMFSGSKRLSQLSMGRGLGILAGWLGTREHFPLWFDSTSWNSPESFK